MMKLNKLQRKSSIPLSVKKEKPERTNFNNIKHTQKLLKEETTLLNSNITHWNIDDSIVSNPEFNMSGLRRLPKSASAVHVHALINTPKILELDINRMIISENKIAAPVYPNDRQQNNIRQYISVTRPSGASTLDTNDQATARGSNSPTLPPINKRDKLNKKDSNENDIAELESVNGSETLELNHHNTEL